MPQLSLASKTEEKLVFSDSHVHHSVNCFSEGKMTHSLGGSQGIQNGFTVRFQWPLALALVSYGEPVFVCDTSNQAIRLISNLRAYKLFGE